MNRGARTYLAHAVKAATHPVRRDILKSLKKGPQSTIDLEEELKESRYNLTTTWMCCHLQDWLKRVSPRVVGRFVISV